MNIKCPQCHREYDIKLDLCPFCGKPAVGPVAKCIWGVIFIIVPILLIWGIVSCVSSCKNAEKERAKEESIYGSQSMACSLVIQSIERRLLNPKRADIDIDYPNIKQDKEKKTFTITGKVEAPNAFGAMLLKPFSATVQYDGYGYKLINLNLE